MTTQATSATQVSAPNEVLKGVADTKIKVLKRGDATLGSYDISTVGGYTNAIAAFQAHPRVQGADKATQEYFKSVADAKATELFPAVVPPSTAATAAATTGKLATAKKAGKWVLAKGSSLASGAKNLVVNYGKPVAAAALGFVGTAVAAVQQFGCVGDAGSTLNSVCSAAENVPYGRALFAGGLGAVAVVKGANYYRARQQAKAERPTVNVVLPRADLPTVAQTTQTVVTPLAPAASAPVIVLAPAPVQQQAQATPSGASVPAQEPVKTRPRSNSVDGGRQAAPPTETFDQYQARTQRATVSTPRRLPTKKVAFSSAPAPESGRRVDAPKSPKAKTEEKQAAAPKPAAQQQPAKEAAKKKGFFSNLFSKKEKDASKQS